MNSVVCMLYRSYQSVRLRCPNSPLDSTCPFWRAKEYSLGHSSIPRWRASMREVRRQGVLRWFVMEQGLGQGWVLAPLLFNTFLTAVINVAYTRFKADIDILDASVLFLKKISPIADGPHITIQPVVFKDLPISPLFTPYNLLQL